MLDVSWIYAGLYVGYVVIFLSCLCYIESVGEIFDKLMICWISQCNIEPVTVTLGQLVLYSMNYCYILSVSATFNLLVLHYTSWCYIGSISLCRASLCCIGPVGAMRYSMF